MGGRRRPDGNHINYQGVGSTSGRQFYIENQVDFADSDIPFVPPGDDEPAQRPGTKTYQYLPTVAGGTSIMYNLRTPRGDRITNLRLIGRGNRRIFTGKLTNWTDPEIKAENPPARPVPTPRSSPGGRSDGSGTSAMFSSYPQLTRLRRLGSFAAQYDAAAQCSSGR